MTQKELIETEIPYRNAKNAYYHNAIEINIARKSANITTATKEHIANAVCRIMNVSLEQVRAENRQRQFVYTRHLISYFIREYCKDMSLNDIGRYLYRNHSTILHSYIVSKNLIKFDEVFRSLAKKCKYELAYLIGE